MMIGILTANDLLVLLYETLVIYCLAGFAFYDLLNRRVPDRALVFFCPVALAAPFVAVFFKGQSVLTACGNSLAGAAASFLILLAAALATHNGTGIGGGDIKLGAILGFIYGPDKMIIILLTASALAFITALVAKRKAPSGNLALPFVPFLAIGNLAAIAASIF